MEIFNFCWTTLLAESKKCSVFFDKDTCNVKNDIDENFSKPVCRIAYLYKFGSYNVSFFHQCFKEFMKASYSSTIIEHFLSIKNPTICSMSAGPGTDIIGLLYSLYLLEKPLMNPTTFRIISIHGAWRQVVTEMINSSIINVPGGSTCQLIGCDYLQALSAKAQNYLKAADILLMCDSFQSSVVSEKKICHALKMTIQVLKPGALVFLIFSEEKAMYFKELDSFGSFLYWPAEVTLENMPYNEKVAELVGVIPLCSGRSMFAVWQKFHKINPEINAIKDNSFAVCSSQQSSTKISNSTCNVRDINSPILNMPNLKREFSSDTNISSSDFVIDSIASLLSSSSPIIDGRNKPIFPDNSVNFNAQSVYSSEKSISTAKNASMVPVNASDSSLGKKFTSESLQKKSERNVNNASTVSVNASASSLGKKFTSSESFQKKSERNGNDMNSLVKNLDNLITKFEGLISSQNILKNCHTKEKQFSSCQHYHQSLHQNQCVQPHQFNENTCCCHSMLCCKHVNVGSHNCSLSKANNLYRTSQEGPCIVIPLQNLSNESLTQILSIVSSENKATSNVPPKEEKFKI